MTHQEGASLGLGLATLMREPSAKRRRHLLDEAYDLGYRHFDVAPLYGLGAAEAELGRFLATGHDDATVTTKIGIAPSRIARTAAHVQAPLRHLVRRSGRLRTIARNAHKSVVVDVDVTAESLQKSLDQSLRRLRRDRVDYLLLHELPATQLSPGAETAVSSMLADGRVGRFGISGDPAVIQASGVDRSNVVSVVQTSDSLRPGVYFERQDVAWMHYGVLGGTLKRLAPVLHDRQRAGEAEDLLQRPLRSLDDLAGVLLLLSATARPSPTVLVGTTSSDHLRLFADCLRLAEPPHRATERVRTILNEV